MVLFAIEFINTRVFFDRVLFFPHEAQPSGGKGKTRAKMARFQERVANRILCRGKTRKKASAPPRDFVCVGMKLLNYIHISKSVNCETFQIANN